MDSYNKLRVIGKGSYGEVWLAKHKRDRKQYVLKKMSLQTASKRERKAAEQEAKLLAKLKHPNIVSYKDSFETDDGFLYIAMGFCEGGDLYTRLKEQKGSSLDERQVVEWFVQIAMALQYMHERNILHRDLKTQNIFLTKSKIIKVGDLGIARVLDGSNDMATTLIGTPYYMSPELFSNKPYNHKSDVWALGCCVYEMATLKHAFNAKDMNSLVYKILRGKMPMMPRIYSAELVTLIKAMLHQSPDKRPSVNRILRDQYIKRNIAMFLEGTRKKAQIGGGDIPDSSRSRTNDESRLSSGDSKAIVQKICGSNGEKLEPLNIGPELAPIIEEQTPRSSVDQVVNKSSPGRQNAINNRNILSNKEYSHNRVNVKVQSRNLPLLPPQNAKPPPVYPRPVPLKPNPANIRKTEYDRDDNEIRPRPHSNSPVNDLRRPRPQSNSPKRTRPRTPGKKPNLTPSPSDLPPSGRGPSPNRPSKTNRRRRVRSADYENKPQTSAIILHQRQGSASSSSSSSSIASDSSSNNAVLHSHAQCPLTPSAEAQHIFNNVKQVENPRPLPPRPLEAKNDPQYSSRCNNSSHDSVFISTDLNETPRGANLSARERRRQKKEIETPRTARSYDMDRARRSSYPDNKVHAGYRSVDYPSNKGSNMDENDGSRPSSVSSIDKNKLHKQPSLTGESSSSSAEETEEDTTKTDEREKKRKAKEMNNFISLLDHTLQMNRNNDPGDKSEEEAEDAIPEEDEASEDVDEEPEEETPAIGVTYNVSKNTRARDQRRHQMHKAAAAQPRGLGVSTRLMDRISILRKDCIHGLGVPVLKQAYDILDNIEGDELEDELVKLLGREKFEIYAGKIWQLKFCEESAFKIC